MNRLYLVRHGENRANVTKEFSYKKTDYPLTSRGVQQAQQTAKYFVDKGVHEIYCSPMKRAVETAEIIANAIEVPVTVMESFHETNVGELDGQPGSAENWALHNEIFEGWLAGKSSISFPGGEDYDTLWGRIQAGIKRVIAGKMDRNIIVVGHGGWFLLTMKDLCQDIDIERFHEKAVHNCSITELIVEEKDNQISGKLIVWASHDHLYGKAAEFVPGIPQIEIVEGREVFRV